MPQEISSENTSFENAKVSVLSNFNSNEQVDIAWSSPDQCLSITEHQLVPTWEFDLRRGSQLFHARVIGRRPAQIANASFHAVEASIFQENSLHERVNIAVEGVDERGTLCNPFFETAPTNLENPALAIDNKFEFATDDPRFADTSVFTNATLMMRWFIDHGYDWNKENILLVVKDKYTERSNAEYTPGDRIISNQRPAIRFGEEVSGSLHNLTTDADVVGHELGHHVIYKSIKSRYMNIDEKIMHEGLADFFRFAKTGDACLAESICPASGDICIVPRQCLRTADNTMGMDEARNNGPHRGSQFLSGMLWDFSGSKGMNRDEAARIAIRAIDYIPTEGAYFRDLVLALMIADRSINNGVNACNIDQIARQRGMTSMLEGVDCHAFATP